MNHKICLITGANSGIGKAAAIQLAKQGHRVLIGARDRQRGRVALDEIKQQSGSEQIELVEMDLSLKSSILNARTQILSQVRQLDVIVHNAADFDISRKKPHITPEGVESIWATNHLGPVFLTQQLLDLLKASGRARILTVASKGLVLHPNLKIDLMDPEFKSRSFSVAKAYYQSKLAQLMYTFWLAEKLAPDQITVNCIRVPNVKIDISRYPNLSPFLKSLYALKSRFSISPDEMAAVYTYLSTSADLDHVSGKYFDENKRMLPSSDYSQDKKNIEALMTLTYQYLE